MSGARTLKPKPPQTQTIKAAPSHFTPYAKKKAGLLTGLNTSLGVCLELPKLGG
jgi:hypothetical protein